MFYVTTAIDYPNGKPHIGHAYEKILADVLTRYQRLKGAESYFLTGVDQHGQKMVKTAEAEGVNAVSERTWLLTLKPKAGTGEPSTFKFPEPTSLVAKSVFKQYSDADLK